MNYDFDELILRRGTNSYKWDTPEEEGVLPMWVADMDFRTAPLIIEALQKRVRHGIFGYTKVPEKYYEAVTNWFARRHYWQIKREWILYTIGVVPAISAVIKAMTTPGDKVIVQTPVFNCFFSSIRNNGCEIDSNLLIYKDGRYTIDYEDLERRAADPKAKILLLCNPHNPAGRVWTKDELTHIGDICIRHGVFIISDEIHCELTYEGHDYTPFASISETFRHNSVTCISASKAFNIAGLQIANIICDSPALRRRIDKAVNINEVCDVNPFGVIATITAYNDCGDWLDALRRYLWKNYETVKTFFAERLPQFPLLPLEGTYLIWIDCGITGMKSKELADRLLEQQQLMVSPGIEYGAGGDNFIRLNIACPRSRLIDGLERLERGLDTIVKQL